MSMNGAPEPSSVKSLADFQGFLKENAGNLVLALFVEDWSERSIEMFNTLRDLSQDLKDKDKLAFCRVEAENQPEICSKYKIVGVPTVIYIRNEREIDRVSGNHVRQAVDKMKQLLLSSIGVDNTRSSEVTTSSSGGTFEGEPLEERLNALINLQNVMLFMKGTPEQPRCGFSRTIVGILNDLGVQYGSFDILQDEEVRQGLKTYSNWQTYPQVYVKGTLIGGLDVVKELQESGELMEALNPDAK